jgi:RNase P subunit RPR2
MVVVVGKNERAVKRVTCYKCAAILEYTQNETTRRSYSACGSLEHGLFITCPNCQNWVEV